VAGGGREDLGSAVLELVTDPAKLKAGMAAGRAETLATLREIQTASHSLFQGIGQGIGQATFGAVQDGIRAIGSWIVGSTKAASDLNESINKTDVVFGAASDSVEQFSKTTAKGLGQSRQQALEAAASFGNVFKTVGLADQASAGMSTTLVKLASDMASFNNQDPSDMLMRLQSGLAGEAEPLRRYGVLLSEARVKAKAMEMGLADANGQLSEGAKVQARYALILADTVVQQGDFARTAEGAANKQRILDAKAADLAATFGQKLLPVMNALTDVAIYLVDHFDELLPVLGGVAALIGATLIPTLLRMGVAAVAATGPFAPLVAIIAAIGVAAASAGPQVEFLKGKIAELENEGGLVGFLDFNRQGKLDELKRILADVEAAEAAAAAKEKADLLERQKAWASWVDGVKATLGDLATDLGAGGVPAAVDGMVNDIDAGLKRGKYKIENGALVMASGIPSATKSKGAAAVKEVIQTIGDMARAIADGRQKIVDAMHGVIDEAYDPLILAADIAATRVDLAEQRKIISAKGSTKAQVAEARRRTLELEKQLAGQLADQTRYGTDAQRLALLVGRATSKELIAGLHSGDEARRLAGRAAASEIAEGIIALEKASGVYGTRTGNAYVDGLIAAFEQRVADTKKAFGPYWYLFKASSPPGPGSPLHDIDKWGYATGAAWVNPLNAALGHGLAAVRRTIGSLRSELAGGPGAGPVALGRIERMGAIRVDHRHTIDAKSAANLAAAGVDPREFAKGLAEASTDAGGLLANLQALQAMSGS